MDPARQQAWELLIGSLTESPEELISVCKKRLEYEDSARNRLFLAKALAKSRKWDKAAEQAEAAIKRDEDNATAHLMLAALTIRRSVETQMLKLAMTHMFRVDDLLKKLPAGDERSKIWREYMLNGAIISALNDQPTEAKDWLDSVLKNFPGDQTAKDILTAIE